MSADLEVLLIAVVTSVACALPGAFLVQVDFAPFYRTIGGRARNGDLIIRRDCERCKNVLYICSF